ncbi:MAG: hypothetical protein RBG13Loki_4421 [Promethearchaeota archaeon CR_4]|nr:MAG: hypothetical protein RBG13Loki_4421 [Candidatus Lokiarchaeota archaeon CR_4]
MKSYFCWGSKKADSENRILLSGMEKYENKTTENFQTNLLFLSFRMRSMREGCGFLGVLFSVIPKYRK